MDCKAVIFFTIFCIIAQNCTPTPIFDSIIEQKVELVKNTIEHGKHKVQEMKGKVADATETGVETVKEMARSGVEAVKSAGSAVVGMVVAPFQLVGSKLNSLHTDSVEHEEVLLPGYTFTPESGLQIPLVSEGGLPLAGQQPTYVIIKEHVQLPDQHIVVETPGLPIVPVEALSDDLKVTSNYHDKIDVEPSVENTVLPEVVKTVEKTVKKTVEKASVENTGRTFPFWYTFRNGLSKLPIINLFTGKPEKEEETISYIFVPSLENTPYHQVHLQPTVEHHEVVNEPALVPTSVVQHETVKVNSPLAITGTLPGLNYPVNYNKKNLLQPQETVNV